MLGTIDMNQPSFLRLQSEAPFWRGTRRAIDLKTNYEIPIASSVLLIDSSCVCVCVLCFVERIVCGTTRTQSTIRRRWAAGRVSRVPWWSSGDIVVRESVGSASLYCRHRSRVRYVRNFGNGFSRNVPSRLLKESPTEGGSIVSNC